MANHWVVFTKLSCCTLTVLSKMGSSNSALLTGTSDCLPSIPNKEGKATDNMFALIETHQCGILMDVLGWQAAFMYPPPVQDLWFQQRQLRRLQSMD